MDTRIKRETGKQSAKSGLVCSEPLYDRQNTETNENHEGESAKSGLACSEQLYDSPNTETCSKSNRANASRMNNKKENQVCSEQLYDSPNTETCSISNRGGRLGNEHYEVESAKSGLVCGEPLYGRQHTETCSISNRGGRLRNENYVGESAKSGLVCGGPLYGILHTETCSISNRDIRDYNHKSTEEDVAIHIRETYGSCRHNSMSRVIHTCEVSRSVVSCVEQQQCDVKRFLYDLMDTKADRLTMRIPLHLDYTEQLLDKPDRPLCSLGVFGVKTMQEFPFERLRRRPFPIFSYKRGLQIPRIKSVTLSDLLKECFLFNLKERP
ncbi:hypothetical protein J6590_007207 [Homalodisca vitripennis]|nr:hypothetical protein J6590_007207 [Homalodisca vitripennis]